MKMASPRAALSAFKLLSPQKLPSVSTIRQVVSPKTPVRNSLTVQHAYQNPISPTFNIYSPNKKLHAVSSKTSIKNNLTVDHSYQNQIIPSFNIDTPNKKKIVDEGFPEKQCTVLGNGAFGTVYKACYKGKDVAAKIVKSNKIKDWSQNMEEKTIFLRHKNIVKILKVDEGPALTLITMELCGKSLGDILDEHAISEEKRINIWESMARALKYCHEMGVVHADVKPNNVLMGTDEQPKLADFGSAVFINEVNTPLVFHGTPGYAAPEVVRGNLPIPQSDIYSLGILAWQMLSRKPPFAGLHKHTIIYLTGKGTTPSDNLNDGFKGKYKDLYKKCWSVIPENRLNVVEIIKKLKKLQFEIVDTFRNNKTCLP